MHDHVKKIQSCDAAQSPAMNEHNFDVIIVALVLCELHGLEVIFSLYSILMLWKRDSLLLVLPL